LGLQWIRGFCQIPHDSEGILGSGSEAYGMSGLTFDDDENLRFSAEVDARVLMGLKESVEAAYRSGILTPAEFDMMYDGLHAAWEQMKEKLKRLGARPLLDEKE
jgi:hypothetical protein